MKKPTLEEVREYFKDAKVVRDSDGDTIDLTNPDTNIFDSGSGYYAENNEYAAVRLFYHGNPEKYKGYAEIVEYKEPKWKLKITNNEGEVYWEGISEPIKLEWEPDKPIDKVTIERLDMVLRLNNIQLSKSILDAVIDAVELIEDKGDQVTLEDIVNMKNPKSLL